MGWPGTGALGAFGMPGLGAAGPAAPGIIGGRGWPSFIARSGRGGTTGRAAGCPARGRAAEGAPGDAVAGRASGCLGGAGVARWTTAGRGAAGAPGRAPSGAVLGNGWRGPVRICPGLGADGSGLGAGAAGRPGAPTAAREVSGAAGADA